ncbi:uncharacterized protein AMSG_07054 [Thecamonas trahens ATCC 50062]|uniref:Senescence domain-containing protein n=1 Tax=Thecamonas trahens ATCC 50062 TaxID=461836 RepID=A0A0L0DFH9_THETB|nr:hypothetical protein AMSG_07054 [Thecamonas trahens ATCC 50062]KNC51067.1 hypothetical protein AMSG_07054 [Thecamonas trahens ATCC 50062]|eukprot:XP_013756526.1 hypothetical protein AMSG_07054 [Thecamonas trahens ATCC 50062]
MSSSEECQERSGRVFLRIPDVTCVHIHEQTKTAAEPAELEYWEVPSEPEPVRFLLCAQYMGIVLPPHAPPQAHVILDNLLAFHTKFADKTQEKQEVVAEPPLDRAESSADEASADAPPAESSQIDAEPAAIPVITTAGAASLEAGEVPESTAPPSSTVAAVMTGVANVLDSSAATVGKAVISSAEVVGSGVASTGVFVQSKIKPASKPLVVSDGVKTKVAYVNKLSSAAVTVSDALVNGVRAMASTLGQAAADAISETEYGRKFNSGTAGPKMMAAKRVGVSAISAVDTMLSSLYSAGHILASNVSSATTDVVAHRYGGDAGEVTKNTLSAVGHVTESVLNINKIGYKSLVGIAAKETTKGVLVGDAAASSATKSPEQLLLESIADAHTTASASASVPDAHTTASASASVPDPDSTAGANSRADAGADANADASAAESGTDRYIDELNSAEAYIA